MGPNQVICRLKNCFIFLNRFAVEQTKHGGEIEQNDRLPGAIVAHNILLSSQMSIESQHLLLS